MQKVSSYLTQLRSTAEAATRGPWYDRRMYGVSSIETLKRDVVAHAVEYAKAGNAQFITRWDPATALLVMDVLEGVEGFRVHGEAKNGTHADIMFAALAALKAHVEGEAT